MPNINFTKQPPIPGYEPIRPLGINLGTVYLARHSSSGILVGLIVWPTDLESHARDLYEPLARLCHPNIIRVIDMGKFQAIFFCAIEYVEKTLADLLIKGALPDERVVQFTLMIISALRHAKIHEVIPIGLTPKSILITDDNLLKLSAFDLSEKISKRSTPPSLALMAPEWLRAGVVTASEASQIYLLGILMYEMLTAKPPFEAKDTDATLERVLNEMPEPLSHINPWIWKNL